MAEKTTKQIGLVCSSVILLGMTSGAGASLPTWSSSTSAKELDAMIKAGEGKKAYDIAESQLDDKSGNPNFDFVYALAAIEAGFPEKAVFPLERLLIQFPNNHRARLELARALYMVGDYVSSRNEFERVKEESPPQNVLVHIDNFLVAIGKQQGRRDSNYSPYAEVSMGYDTNVNSATDARTVATSLGSLLLDETSQSKEDSFLDYELGVGFNFPQANNEAWYGKLSVEDRRHATETAFDLTTATAMVGYERSIGKNQFRIPVTAQQSYLDDSTYRMMLSAGLEYSRQVGANSQFATSMQAGLFRYDDSMLQNVDYFLAIGSYAYSFSPVPVVVNAAIVYQNESATHNTARYNGKNAYTAQLSGQWFLLPKHSVYTTLGAGYSEYKTLNPIFTVEREENSLSARLGWNWRYNRNMSFKAEYSFLRNDSNIAVYDYDRQQGSVKFRYDF